MVKKEKGVANNMGESVRDITVNLHKRCHNIAFKKKAPRAIKEIRKLASSVMLTKDVRIEAGLNQALWSNGIRNIPKRIRVRLSRRKNEDENKDGQYYTLVQHVEVDTFKGLVTEKGKSE
jgi:large subunit ribosomal protein L31e